MIDALLRASLEGAVLAVLVWLLLRVVPRIAPAVKAMLWWCVGAKFVIALLPIGHVQLAVLPSSRVQETPVPTASVRPFNASRVEQPAASTSHTPTVTPIAPIDDAPPRLSIVLLAFWALGLLVAMARTAFEWIQTRRVIAHSTPAGASITATVNELAELLGMKSTADVRYSADVDSPLIAGIRRPVILVPAERFPRMSHEHQRMVLCHELVHLKRRDVLFSCVPAAAERLFFFHPLSRLAGKEYAFWREAACDAAVMTALRTPARSYGRLLLDLGVSRQQTLAVANAAMSFSTLKRRLVMLDVPFRPSTGARVVASVAIALALITIAPVRLVARQTTDAQKQAVTKPTTRPDTRAATAGSATATTRATPGNRQAARALGGTVSGTVTGAASASTMTAGTLARGSAPTATTSIAGSAAETADAPPMSASAASAGGSQSVAYTFGSVSASGGRVTSTATTSPTGFATSYTTNTDDQQQDRLSYVLFVDDNYQTMSGSTRDMQRAREFRERGESLLWFRLDGREYIVRDPAVLRAAMELWEPVSRIGAEQGKIGAQQGAIGARQGQYGARQGEIGAEQGVVAARQGAIAAQYGVLSAREARRLSESERSEISRERARLDREMRELDREMHALNERMRNLDRPNGDIAREMSELGKVMSELGREMSEASRKAERDMLRLVERAIESGAAQSAR